MVNQFGVGEYFDYGVKYSFLKRFFELTPTELLESKYCDVRLQLCIQRDNLLTLVNPGWLMIHYRLPLNAKAKAFRASNAGLGNNHSSALSQRATKDDEDIAASLGVGGIDALKIAWDRERIEEQVIGYVARDQRNLEATRNEMVGVLQRELCNNEVPGKLWQQCVEKFESCFSPTLREANTKWCMEGNVPYSVSMTGLDGNQY